MNTRGATGRIRAAAPDQVLAEALESDAIDCDETVAAVMQAYESVKAGRAKPADEVLEELRARHGFPR